MEINISIKKEIVFQEVSKITGYTGKNIQKDGALDLVAITGDEKDLFSSFFSDAIMNLFDQVRRFNASIKNDSDPMLTFDMPPNFDETAISGLEGSMPLFIIKKVCAKWFNLSKKDEVEYYERECSSILNNLFGLLNARKKPIKK